MNKKLRILFLTPRFPYPLIGGDRLKPYYILKHLGKHHDVTLVTFFQGSDLPKSHINEIEKLGVRLIVVPLDPITSGLMAAMKLLTKNPLEIDYYYSNTFNKAVKELNPEKNFDIAIAFFMRTAEYIKDYKLPKILMAEDCRTIYQYRSYRESINLTQKFIRKWEYNKLKKYEPEIVKYFDIVTLVSNDDIRQMQKLNSGVEYRLLSNGTDLSKFTFNNNIRERKGILFAGKLDIWANQLMINTIVNEIFPNILKKLPDCEFHIAGAKPPHRILALKDKKNIHLHIDVPIMLPYLHNSRLFLHPHSGGSGIQNKLLEAMACGCPVITTPTGNQGIYAKNEESAIICNTKEEMVRYAIKILTDDEFASNLAKNARVLIEEKHSWEAIYLQLDAILEELIN